MNDLKIFSYENKEVRTVVINEEPWWVTKDICEYFGDSNYRRSISRLDEDEKGVSRIDTPGGRQEMSIVNESGLYSLLFNMQPQQANVPEQQYIERMKSIKQFKRWITHEVLPSIRKNGLYAKDELLDNPDLLIDIITKLRDERNRTKQLEDKIQSDSPKVIFADAVAVSNTSILVGDLSKILKQNGVDTGASRLFEWMRTNGYLIRRKGTDYNMPTQLSMNMELFEIKETVISHADGHTSINKTPKVTGKGQVYFVNKLTTQKEQ